MMDKSYGKMSEYEKHYQTEEDVRTLVRYQEIHKDKARYGRAMKYAKEQAKTMADAAGMEMGKMSMKSYAKKRKKEGGLMSGHQSMMAY